MKFLNFFYFCGSIFPSWIRTRISNTDSDPLTSLNPDPKHWLRENLFGGLALHFVATDLVWPTVNITANYGVKDPDPQDPHVFGLS